MGPTTKCKPILREKLSCSGSELTLFHCNRNINIQEKNHSKNIIIDCLQCKNISFVMIED